MKSKKIYLRAISVAQPWAECIVGLGKNVENRSWETHLRGYVAIHASAYCDAQRFEDCDEAYGIRLNPEKLDFGAVVGFAELVDVVDSNSVTLPSEKWFKGPYGFVLRNAVALPKAVPAKGALKFWTLPPPVQRRALEQLSAAQLKRILRKPLTP